MAGLQLDICYRQHLCYHAEIELKTPISGATVANGRLEPFIYAGSWGVLPEKHSSRKRD